MAIHAEGINRIKQVIIPMGLKLSITGRSSKIFLPGNMSCVLEVLCVVPNWLAIFPIQALMLSTLLGFARTLVTCLYMVLHWLATFSIGTPILTRQLR